MRGRGTLIAFDTKDNVDFQARMRQEGVEMNFCGPRSMRLRPQLVFGSQHADIFLEKLSNVLKSY